MIPGFHANSMIEHDLATAGSVLRRIGFGAIAVRTSLAKLDPLADESTRNWQIELLASGARDLSLIIDADGRFLVDPWVEVPPCLADRSSESDRHAEYIAASIDLVGEMGGGLVSFSTGRKGEELDLQSSLDRLAEVVRRLSEVAQASGISIAIRPRAGHLVDSVGSFERLLKWVDAENVKFAADISVMVAGGEMPILDLLNRLGSRLGCVYLSDLKAVVGHLEPVLGSGHVSVGRVVTGLQSGGFAGPIILEPSVGEGLCPQSAETFFQQVFRQGSH